jgi:hypothetical protein
LIGLAAGPPLLVATLGIWQQHERAHTRVQALAYVVQRDIARAEGPIGELAQRLQAGRPRRRGQHGVRAPGRRAPARASDR